MQVPVVGGLGCRVCVRGARAAAVGPLGGWGCWGCGRAERERCRAPTGARGGGRGLRLAAVSSGSVGGKGREVVSGVPPHGMYRCVEQRAPRRSQGARGRKRGLGKMQVYPVSGYFCALVVIPLSSLSV